MITDMTDVASYSLFPVDMGRCDSTQKLLLGHKYTLPDVASSCVTDVTDVALHSYWHKQMLYNLLSRDTESFPAESVLDTLKCYA